MELQDIYYNKSEYVETVRITSDLLYGTNSGNINCPCLNFVFTGLRKQSKQANSTMWVPKYSSAWQGDCSE